MSDHTPAQFVILPRGKLTSDRLALRFAPVSNPDEVKAVEYNRKRHGRLRVGHVYTFGITKDGDAFYIPSEGCWVGEYERTELVREWQAEQKSVDLTEETRALEKKHASNASSINAAIEPLRKAYQSLLPPHRLAFELYVLSAMRRK